MRRIPHHPADLLASDSNRHAAGYKILRMFMHKQHVQTIAFASLKPAKNPIPAL
jgi:hypothetical protein